MGIATCRIALGLLALLSAAALAQVPTPKEYSRPVHEDTMRGVRTQQEEAQRREARTSAGIRSICCRADRVIGAGVQDAAGSRIGMVRDLAINPEDGRIAYGVLSFDGFMGLGDRYFAIPWRALHPQADGTFRLDVSSAQLSEAGGFGRNNWPDMASPQWARATHEQFAQHPPREPQDAAARQPMEHEPDRPMPDRQERMMGTIGGARRIVQGTQLIGAPATDAKQESLGSLKDLLLDVENGRVNCVVLAFDGGLGMGNQFTAVPFPRISIRPKADDSTEPRDVESVVLNVEIEQLQNAPTFTERDWPREDDQEFVATVFEYYNIPLPR